MLRRLVFQTFQQRINLSRFNMSRFYTAAKADLKIDYIASASKRPATHLKREVDRIQEENQDHILLVQVGGFYEIYGIVPCLSKTVDRIWMILLPSWD
jgi:hypothetical protein